MVVILCSISVINYMVKSNTMEYVLMEKLRNSYLVNTQKFTDDLFELFLSDPENFKTNIVFKDFFKDVISMDYTKQDYDFFEEVLNEISQRSKEFSSEFIEDITIVYGVYYSLYNNLMSNTERLNNNKFIDKPLIIQIQTLLSYLQDQYTLSKKVEYSPVDKSILTGFDEYVAKRSNFININHQVKVSTVEILDTTVEIINLILPYLYFKKRNEKLESTFIQNEISPYNDLEFEDLLYITQQRFLLNHVWEKFKFEGWEFFLEKTTETNEDVFYFFPKKEKLELANFYGVHRLTYHLNSSMLLTAVLKESEIVNVYKEINKLSRYSLLEFLDLITKKEYQKINLIAKNKIENEIKFLEEYYYTFSDNGIDIGMIIKFLEFMITLSLVLEEKNYPKEGINNDFSFLVPKLDKERLAKTISRIKEFSEEVSLKLIDTFVFGASLNKGYDLFSKPLVHIDEKTVVYTPYLFTHLNIQKAIQEWIKQCKFDISKKGLKFEEKVTEMINVNQYLDIEKNLNFTASDKKEIEYDLIVKMGNTTVLIEFKNMLQPYTGKDNFKNMSIIKEGVEQLNRREIIFHKDFETINSKLKFNLDPKGSIIKILCTNVYNYTPLRFNEIYITDVSTLSKFFTKPESYFRSFERDRKIHFSTKYSDAWKGSVPDKEDLINFLEHPDSIKQLRKSISSQFKPIFRNNYTDQNIVYQDYYFKNNPYISIIEKSY